MMTSRSSLQDIFFFLCCFTVGRINGLESLKDGVATVRRITIPNSTFLTGTVYSDQLPNEAYFLPWTEPLENSHMAVQAQRQFPFQQRLPLPPSFLHPGCNPLAPFCAGVDYFANTKSSKEPMNMPLEITPSRISSIDLNNPLLPVAYSFFNGTPSNFNQFFMIDPHSGDVLQTRQIPTGLARFFRMLIMAKKSDGSNYASFATLTINVINSPESLFDPEVEISAQQGFIEGEAPLGTAVRMGKAPNTAPLKVRVIDQDLKPGTSPATYQYILSGTAAVYFDIDENGEIVLSSADLRHLKGSQLNLTIVAREAETTPVRSSRPQKLTISVLQSDAADHLLEFASPTYTVIAQPFVSEQRLIQVASNFSAAERIHYRILSTSASDTGLFRFDEKNQILVAVKPLSPGTRHIVTLEATDSYGKSGRTMIIIDVLQSQPLVMKETKVPATAVTTTSTIVSKSTSASAPASTSAPSTLKPMPKNVEKMQNEIAAEFNISVKESVPPNSLIMTLTTEDSQPNDMTFRIVSGNTGNAFRVNKTSGEIFTNTSMDYEKVPYYDLIFEVNGPGFTTNVRVQLFVLDENENAPSIMNRIPIVFTIDGDSETAVIGQVRAVDADSGRNGEITYEIQPPNKYFTIDPKDGTVRAAANLQSLESSTYVLRVLAQDGGSPTLATAVDVTINIKKPAILTTQRPLDYPVFVETQYNVTVLENDGPKDLLYVKATYSGALEHLQQPITYELKNGNRSLFAIDPLRGLVSTLTALDAEAQRWHRLTVGTAENARKKRPATADIWIYVEDVNEFSPTFTKTTYTATVDESIVPGTVILNVSAHDQDAESSFTFAMISDDEIARDHFDIDRFVGSIRVSKPLSDIEKSKIEFYVQAFDCGSPPRYGNAEVIIYLNRTARKLPTATMPPATTASDVLDVESTEAPTVIEPLQSIMQKSITLPPVFSSRIFHAKVREAVPAPQQVLVLPMENKSPHQAIQYAITSGNHEGAFTIRINENGLCVIETEIDLDRELIATYRLNVTAYVSTYAGLELADSTNIDVEVLDANDHPPAFQFDPDGPKGMTYYAAASAGTKPLTPILRVTATDEDAGDNSMITYSLPNLHPDSQYFMIDEWTGQIRNKVELTGLEAVTYEFNVRATDKPSHYPPLSSEASVVINVVRDLNRFMVVISKASVVSRESVVTIVSAVKRLMMMIHSPCKIIILEYIRRSETSANEIGIGTELTLVAINPLTKKICPTAEISGIFGQSAFAELKAMLSPKFLLESIVDSAPVAPGHLAMTTKTAEIILGSFGGALGLMCIIGVTLLCYYWNRTKKHRVYSTKTSLYGILPKSPVMLMPSGKEYETQMLELTVPEEHPTRKARSFGGDEGASRYSTDDREKSKILHEKLSRVYLPPPDYPSEKKSTEGRSKCVSISSGRRSTMF